MIQSPLTPTPSCPECGTPAIAGFTCWEQFCAVLAWEWQDPELQAQHFLTVASYNLQHPAQFTGEALAGLRAVFKEHLDHGFSIAAIRQRVSSAVDGKQRVLKNKEERLPVLQHWDMTIADVFSHNQPEGAAERVRKWAAAVRSQL